MSGESAGEVVLGWTSLVCVKSGISKNGQRCVYIVPQRGAKTNPLTPFSPRSGKHVIYLHKDTPPTGQAECGLTSVTAQTPRQVEFLHTTDNAVLRVKRG